MRAIYATIALIMSSTSEAHEMLPTYPELKPSYVSGVVVAQMRMFNKRRDVEFYEVAVFDEDWNSVPFVTGYRILKVKYLSHVNFDVYVRESDAKRAQFICSTSKMRSGSIEGTVVASRICSKFAESRP